MSEPVRQPTIFCISTYEKGQAFLREAARLGCRVFAVHAGADAGLEPAEIRAFIQGAKAGLADDLLT